MQPSLKNPKLKIARAKEHLDALNVKLREYLDTKPVRITGEEDIKNGLYVVRYQISVIDPQLAIIASDTIYNLRSSLDHIAWQLALTAVSRPHDHTAFPVVDKNTPKKMARFKSVTKDIPAAAIDEIEALQPYHKGAAYQNEILWRLDKLCNIDKHRVIPAEGTVLDLQIPKGVSIGSGVVNSECVVSMPIAGKAQMQRAPQPTFDIVLGSRVDGLVISISELPTIYAYVRDAVLPRFTQFFP